MIIWTSFSLLAFLLSSFWLVSEIVLGRMVRSKSEEARRLDSSSLRWLWVSIGISLPIGIFLGMNGIGYVAVGGMTISVVGLTLIVIGLVIRWTAILTLRRYFTTNVSIQQNHQLVARGLYRIIRHPAYSGSLLSFLGLGLTFANWLTTLVIFLPICCAFLYRIRVEERALIEHFGVDYEQYRQRTKRLIPGIY